MVRFQTNSFYAVPIDERMDKKLYDLVVAGLPKKSQKELNEE